MIRLEFHGEADFEANNAAEAWCRKLGISVGAMQSASPRGLYWGESLIAKWRNLTPKDCLRLDGRLEYSGTPRFGTAIVTIADPRTAEVDRAEPPPSSGHLAVLRKAQGELDRLGIGVAT